MSEQNAEDRFHCDDCGSDSHDTVAHDPLPMRLVPCQNGCVLAGGLPQPVSPEQNAEDREVS